MKEPLMKDCIKMNDLNKCSKCSSVFENQLSLNYQIQLSLKMINCSNIYMQIHERNANIT